MYLHESNKLEYYGKFEEEKIFAMSVAEMKLEAINKITTVENETVLKEVLSLLEDANTTNGVVNLSKSYNELKEQYGDALQRLAQ